MEEKKWFTLLNDQVSGPFKASELEKRVSLGELTDAQFWARGRSHWVGPTQFKLEVVKDREQEKEHLRQQVERPWKLKVENEITENLSYAALLAKLKDLSDLSGVQIWTEGYSDWRDVYQIHKLMDELGISRRQHPRVPIVGTLTVDHPAGTLTSELTSISEGGIGIAGNPKLSIGDRCKGVIQSSALPSRVYSSMEVVYLSENGEAGIRFINLAQESRALIVDYVRRFISR